MSQDGLYVQFLNHGVAVGWDDDKGITLSYFTEAALGVSGSAWASVHVDPRELSWSGFGDDLLDACGSVYFGRRTPI
ncbi:MAG: hypothetical protein AAF583_12355 [Pseudomonadota bacterium]